jgi:hypothetical protein
MKKNKLLILGLLVVTLVFSLAAVGCKPDPETVTTLTVKNEHASLTIKKVEYFTPDSDYNYTLPAAHVYEEDIAPGAEVVYDVPNSFNYKVNLTLSDGNHTDDSTSLRESWGVTATVILQSNGKVKADDE